MRNEYIADVCCDVPSMTVEKSSGGRWDSDRSAGRRCATGLGLPVIPLVIRKNIVPHLCDSRSLRQTGIVLAAEMRDAVPSWCRSVLRRRRVILTPLFDVGRRCVRVMAGADPPSTTCGIDLSKVVDGGAAATMTVCAGNTLTGSVISEYRLGLDLPSNCEDFLRRRFWSETKNGHHPVMFAPVACYQDMRPGDSLRIDRPAYTWASP